MTRSTLIVLYLYARKADKKEDKGGGGNNGEDVVTSLERVAFNVTPSFLSFSRFLRSAEIFITCPRIFKFAYLANALEIHR